MSVTWSEMSMFERAAVDAAVLAYVEWREECVAVWDAYDWWTTVPAEESQRAHAGYRAALDREEAAARSYATRVERLERLVGMHQ